MDSDSKFWGIECMERGPSPRPGHKVMDSQGEDSRIIGYVTSGGPSPSKKMTGIALGYLENCKAGDEVWIQSSSRRRIRSEVKTHLSSEFNFLRLNNNKMQTQLGLFRRISFDIPFHF